MNRRGFLGYLLGSGSAAVAAKIVEPTPQETLAVQQGGYDFACLPKDGVYVKSVDMEIPEEPKSMLSWDAAHTWDCKRNRYIRMPPEIELTVVMRVLDGQRGMEIARFFADRINQGL